MTYSRSFIDSLGDLLNNWYRMHYGKDREGKDLSLLDMNRFNKAVYDYGFLHFCKEDKEAMKEGWDGSREVGSIKSQSLSYRMEALIKLYRKGDNDEGC